MASETSEEILARRAVLELSKEWKVQLFLSLQICQTVTEKTNMESLHIWVVFPLAANRHGSMATVERQEAELISSTDKYLSNMQLVFDDNKRAASGKPTPYMTYAVPARELSITWGNDPRYWRWLSLEENIDIEVAQLLDVCWLEVKGKIGMKRLEPGYKYSVIYVLLMIDPSGFEPKATFSLILPSGEKQKKMLSIAGIKPKQWVHLKMGEFVATGEDGDIIFSLTNKEQLNWKKGMIVAAVLFQPVA